MGRGEDGWSRGGAGRAAKKWLQSAERGMIADIRERLSSGIGEAQEES